MYKLTHRRHSQTGRDVGKPYVNGPVQIGDANARTGPALRLAWTGKDGRTDVVLINDEDTLKELARRANLVLLLRNEHAVIKHILSRDPDPVE